MDPNAALSNIREAVGELRNQDDDGVLDGTSQVGFLLESFEALDDWLTKGGFLPSVWAEQTVVTVLVEPGKEGSEYILRLPSGEHAVIGDAEDDYWTFANLIDRLFPIEEPAEVELTTVTADELTVGSIFADDDDMLHRVTDLTRLDERTIGVKDPMGDWFTFHDDEEVRIA